MASGPSADITGQRFGKLVAIAFTGRSLQTGRVWTCRCDCGGAVEAVVAQIRCRMRSCGCDNPKATIIIDGAASSRHPLRQTYGMMISRCYNPRTVSFESYGGRGIKVCARWVGSFALFVSDMGPKPTAWHSVDRKDNGGDYSPENCRWATRSEQALNRRPRGQAIVDNLEFGQSALVTANAFGISWIAAADGFLEASHLALEDLIEEFGAIDESFDDRMFPFGVAS